MHMWQAVARQPLGVLIGFVGASALFLLVFGLAFASGRVLATHDASGNVHACVNRYTGQARIMLPGRPPTCSAGEALVEWAGGGVVADLEARVAGLETQVPDCLSTEGSDAVFEGCNVHVRNGLDDTATTNATGNLIVGYNEDLDDAEDRGGSHNVVIGQDHTYSSSGGFVAGFSNNITAANASVSGGTDNTASSIDASVSGGFANEASGIAASVSGGFGNTASGEYANVSGGNGRTAADVDDWVAGGLFQDN